ncbi:MAG TPA: long-chain fatty acid--CoA ligase [Candidatus Acidoferrales bacterium]|nr:long-chain fatty acid--CoA ligase [Candidatus Acidoferrales bacterium]
MLGQMMDFPLTLVPILERARNVYSRSEVVWRRPDRGVERYTFADFYGRARKLAEALTRAGLKPGDRVATLMWNHETHLEAYFGIPCAGGVLHPLNLRLHPSELAFIANHAGDRFLIVDDALLPCLESFRKDAKFERIFVVKYGCTGSDAEFRKIHKFENYDDLLETASGDYQFPPIDENSAAAMCYTSGTTGRPKGVVYSHRALVLHSFAETVADAFGINHQDTLLVVAPLFHANGWGLPFTAVMTGAKMVFPGPHVDPESLLELITTERVTASCGVPTVWISVLAELEKNPEKWKLAQTMRAPCGGTAPPEALIRGLDRFGIHLIHLWGMTETAPLATTGGLHVHMMDWSEDEKYAVRAQQGIPAPFIELRVTREGKEVPRDGETAGDLEVRGPWVAASYYNMPEEAARWTSDGWFRTGDVAAWDDSSRIRLVDRSKDLIKSGGEWISSVDLENALMGHPAVREACVVGVPHPKWQERPLAVVVLKENASATQQELREFLGTKFAKWQLPDAFVFSDAIPRTSVGKFLKSKLREEYANWKWE